MGLFHNDVLVAVMLFGRYRKSMMEHDSNCSHELSRFCCLPGYQIIGAASKLLKYFIKHYNPVKIASFSLNDISNGHLYGELGFHKINEFCGSYWYIAHNSFVRYHRYKFRKSELVKMGYSEDLTESEIMKSLPYYKIFDSGTTNWEFEV